MCLSTEEQHPQHYAITCGPAAFDFFCMSFLCFFSFVLSFLPFAPRFLSFPPPRFFCPAFPLWSGPSISSSTRRTKCFHSCRHHRDEENIVCVSPVLALLALSIHLCMCLSTEEQHPRHYAITCGPAAFDFFCLSFLCLFPLMFSFLPFAPRFLSFSPPPRFFFPAFLRDEKHLVCVSPVLALLATYVCVCRLRSNTLGTML